MRGVGTRLKRFWNVAFRPRFDTVTKIVSSAVLAGAAVLWIAPAVRADVCGQWELVPTPIPETGWLGSSQFRDITVIAPDDAWAVGYVYMGSPTWQTLTLAMHWDGSEWTIVPTPSPSRSINELETVVAVSGDDVWAAGIEEQFNPFRELHPLILHWDGTTWEQVDLSSYATFGSWINSIEVVGPDDIWFGGGGAARMIHWDGSNFDFMPMPTFDTGSCSGTYGCGHETEHIAAVAPDDIWAVGGASDGDYSFVSQIFHWDGAEWDHVPGPSISYFQRLNGVAALAPDDVWAVGNLTAEDPTDSGLLIVHWDGFEWSRVSTPLFTKPFGDLQDIVAFAPDDIWAAGIYTDEPPPAIGKPLTMHYDGRDWIQVMPDPDGPESAWLRGLAGANSCDMWAVGSGDETPHVQRLVPPVVPGDIDGDGDVDLADLAVLLAAYDTCAGEPGFDQAADLNSDQCVGIGDLAILLASYSG